MRRLTHLVAPRLSGAAGKRQRPFFPQRPFAPRSSRDWWIHTYLSPSNKLHRARSLSKLAALPQRTTENHSRRRLCVRHAWNPPLFVPPSCDEAVSVAFRIDPLLLLLLSVWQSFFVFGIVGSPIDEDVGFGRVPFSFVSSTNHHPPTAL